MTYPNSSGGSGLSPSPAFAGQALREVKGMGRIFLIGFMGCGKTHWGRLLAERLQLPFFDLDHSIEEKEERPITDIFAAEGEEHFRVLEKEVLHLVTESHDAFVMATGGGTPCFYNNIEYMKSRGLVVWIACSPACLHGRLSAEKAARPLLKDLDDEALLAYITKKSGDRQLFYRQAHITVNGEGLSLDLLVNKISHT